MSCRRSIRFVKLGKYTTSKSHEVRKTYRTYKGGRCLPEVMLTARTTRKGDSSTFGEALKFFRDAVFLNGHPCWGVLLSDAAAFELCVFLEVAYYPHSCKKHQQTHWCAKLNLDGIVTFVCYQCPVQSEWTIFYVPSEKVTQQSLGSSLSPQNQWCSCQGLNVLVSSKFIIESLITNVIILGDRALGR